jgi:hypothetical protein
MMDHRPLDARTPSSRFPGRPIDVRSECMTVTESGTGRHTSAAALALFVIHSSVVDLPMMRVHARTLALSASSWLIKGGDLVYAFNGRADGAIRRSLQEGIANYPQVQSGGRAWLCAGLDNAGYWCGQFCDWHKISTLWSAGPSGAYSAVVYLEDDVFATPLAIRTLERALLLDHDPRAEPRAKRATIEAGEQRPASWFVARYRDGLASARYRHQYNMDLLAHRPQAVSATVWEHACRQCLEGAASNPTKASATKGASPPGGAEGVLWRAVNASGLRVQVLLPATFHSTRKMDAMGVWHTHNASDVVRWLSSVHGVIPNDGGA